MEIFTELNKNEGIAIALGYFDGIHLGHKKVIQTLVEKAREMQVKSAVITFSSNPANYFSDNETFNIQSYKDRNILIDSLGVDYIYDLDFEQFMKYSAQEYLENILYENFKPKLIVVGYNNTFGSDMEGCPDYLNENSQKFNYQFTCIPEQKYNSISISSTTIRKELQEGNLGTVRELLGRNFSIRNSVIKGKGMASKLGYPTINLIWPDNIVKIPYGVYFGHAQVGNLSIPALISWGCQETLTNGKESVLEAHLFDTNKNLYGKIVNVSFETMLRLQEKFSNVNALKVQLKSDYQQFKNWAK